MRFGHSIALACLVASVVACADGRNSAPSLVVRDSAGIRIVENASPVWGGDPGWRIDPIRVTIGSAGDAPGQQLHRVTGAVRLRDGRIVIANSASSELGLYGSDGSYLGSVGGSGEGPGDFRSLGWLGQSSQDSLLTWDLRLNRVAVFTGAGEYVRDYLVSLPLPEAVTGGVALGSLDAGRIVFSRGGSFAPVEGSGVQRQPLSAWVVSAAGEVEREFGPFPGESVNLRAGQRPGMIIRTPVPFGAATLIAAGTDRIYVTDNGRYDIHVYAPDGHLQQIVRRPHELLALLPEDIAADLEARLESLPPVEEIRAGSRASYEAVPKPQFMPAVRSLMVDREGCLWVEASRHMHEPLATWSVFDRDGLWLGDLALAAGLEPLEIGWDYLLLRRQDDLSVESVLVIPLRRGR